MANTSLTDITRIIDKIKNTSGDLKSNTNYSWPSGDLKNNANYSWPEAVDNPDYDKGEVSKRELEAAKRQVGLGEYNAESLANQLGSNIKGFELADEQNAKLRDLQNRQASRAADQERFRSMQNLQQVARGLLSSFGTAGNSSTVGNLMTMLKERNDADSGDNWAQLLKNFDTVDNAFNESANQNNLAKFNAYTDAEKGLRDINADTYANTGTDTDSYAGAYT